MVCVPHPSHTHSCIAFPLLQISHLCVLCHILSPKAVYRVLCPFFRPKMFSPGDREWYHSRTLGAHVLSTVVGPSPNGLQFCHIRYIRPGGVTPVDYESAQISRLKAVVDASPKSPESPESPMASQPQTQQFKVCYSYTQKFFTVPLDPQQHPCYMNHVGRASMQKTLHLCSVCLHQWMGVCCNSCNFFFAVNARNKKTVTLCNFFFAVSRVSRLTRLTAKKNYTT